MPFFYIDNDIKLQAEKTLTVKDKLTKNIKFMHGDMFEKIKELKDESNTILMFIFPLLHIT